MKSYRPLLFVVGTLLLLIAAAALISNRSSLAQESTPEAPAPPEQTVEVTSEVVPIVSPEAPLVATLPLLPDGTPGTLPTPDALILTATAIGNPLNGGQISTPGQPLVSPSTQEPYPTTHTGPHLILFPTAQFIFPDPAQYRIVYFIAPGTISDESLISPNNLLGEMLPSGIAYTWDDVVRIDRETPIDAIIIHRSAYDLVDRTWAAQALRRGVVFSVINMYYAELAQMQNDQCGMREAANYPDPFAGQGYDYFYINAFLVFAENPAEQSLVEASAFDTCVQNPQITAGVRFYSHATHRDLAVDGHVMGFVQTLMVHIDGIRGTKTSFENRNLPATLVPFLETPVLTAP